VLRVRVDTAQAGDGDRSITDAGDALSAHISVRWAPRWSPAPGGLTDDQAD
jgi:hypothetical protein